MKFKPVTFFVLTFILLFNCQTKDKIPPLESITMKSSKVIIYQMMVRLFGNTSSLNKPNGTRVENGCGKFNDVNESALTNLKGLGVTHIYFTGVLEHATLSDYSFIGIASDHPHVVKGRAGSPFAIKDYYDVDPDLAVDPKNRMKEFELMVGRTHQAGLRAIIDFIPNHVARQG